MKILDDCELSSKTVDSKFSNNVPSKEHSKKIERFYDSLSKHYDEKWWYNNPDSRHIKKFTTKFIYSHVKPGSTILDVGCGTCDTAIKLATKNCEIVGFDLSSKMLTVGSEKIPTRYKDRVFLTKGNAEMLPFRDNKFDYVLSEFSLDYVSNPATTMKEMVRVLKEEGKLILVVSNRKPLYIIFWEFVVGNWKFINGLKEKEEEINFSPAKIKTSFRRYSSNELDGIMADLPVRKIEMFGTHGFSGFIGYPIILWGLFLHKVEEGKSDSGKIDHYVNIKGGEIVFNIFEKSECIDRHFKTIGRDIVLLGEKTKQEIKS